ncbi:MAG TPA: hypothetical protein PLM75_00900 [bacterium]|nr:hypothetical protein [bacterium]
MKFKISTFCILLVLIFSFQTFAEVKKARIVSFQKEEVEEGIEIFLSAEYCLRNSKLFATVRNTITGEVSEYEIERIFYDIEKLDAQFTGISLQILKQTKLHLE